MSHLCHAIGCKTAVPPRLLMCARHWRMVPAALQSEVWRTYRPGQEVRKDPSAAYLAAADAAIKAVAALGAPPAPRPARVYSIHHSPPRAAVYIGRPGPRSAGPWGNPVALGRACPECGATHGRADIPAACACYEAILRRRLAAEPDFAAAFDALRGHDLVCFCAPSSSGLGIADDLRCHGQIMLRVLAERGTP